jgi:type II secretion system protein H
MRAAAGGARRPARRLRLAPGFSLLELMVVIAIIGVLAAMIVPEVAGSYRAALLRAAGRELASVLGLAHSEAVTSRKPHRLRLELSSGRYTLEAPRSAEESPGRYEAVRRLAGASGQIDRRIRITLEAPGGGERGPAGAASGNESEPRGREEVIHFRPDGTADAGELILEDEEGFALSLRIHPITARVEVKDRGREAAP